jgi:hypothetical protein
MGRVKLKKLSKTDSMGKALYKSQEPGKMGNQKVGYKHTFEGELNVIPCRICWKNRK